MRFHKLYFFLLVGVLLFPLINFSQESLSQKQVLQLSIKIKNHKGSERLYYMDSLSNLSLRLELDSYETIATSTIDYALKLDSTKQALIHSHKLISYYNNIGKYKKTIIFYEDHLRNHLNKLTPQQRASLYLEMAGNYDYTGKRVEALKLYDSTISISKNHRLTMLQAQAQVNKGYVYASQGAFAQATLSLKDAQQQYRKVKDTTELPTIELVLANLYSQIGFYKEAKENRDLSEKEALERNDFHILTNLYFNQSTDEQLQGNRAREIQLILKAIKYAELDGSLESHSLDFYPRLSSAYSQTGSLEKASEYLEKIKKVEAASKNDITRNMYLLAGKEFAFAKADYQQALSLGEEHMDLLEQYEGYDHLTDAQLFLSKTYEKTGMPDKALGAYRSYMSIRDSIFDSQKTNALSYYQTLHESEKKEAQIALQNEELALMENRNRLKNLHILIGVLAVFSIGGLTIYIVSRRRARFKQEQQSQFTKKLLKTQEQERIRIARDIHDSVGQKLVLLSKSSSEDNFKKFNHLAGESLAELREISSGLYPMHLEQLGLTESLTSMINQMDDNSDILMEHSIDNLDEILNGEEKLQLYRIVQEAVSNIIKHSHGQEARVELKKEKKGYELTIWDNGRGFDITKFKMGIGIATMRQRAQMINAILRVQSNPMKGTTLNIYNYG